MTESKFKVGDIVILQNLKIHPECNGLETTVIGPNVLRQSLRGSEPMPVAYLYEVDINLAGCEPGLLVAEYQMRHRKPPVELGNWSVIEKGTNWNPTNVTANTHPTGTPLPTPVLPCCVAPSDGNVRAKSGACPPPRRLDPVIEVLGWVEIGRHQLGSFRKMCHLLFPAARRSGDRRSYRIARGFWDLWRRGRVLGRDGEIKSPVPGVRW